MLSHSDLFYFLLNPLVQMPRFLFSVQMLLEELVVIGVIIYYAIQFSVSFSLFWLLLQITVSVWGVVSFADGNFIEFVNISLRI